MILEYTMNTQYAINTSVVRSFASKCFTILSSLNIVSLLILFALQNILLLTKYVPYILQYYDQLILKLGIATYSDAMIPLTPWLYLTAISPINLTSFLMITNMSLSAIVLVFTWLLAIITKQKKNVPFIAGLLLLSTMITLLMPYITPDSILFAAIILLAIICLYKGWMKSSAPFWLTIGFLLTGCAGLTGGLIGFFIPLISSLIFLIWSGNLRRAGRYDGALAFGLMLVMLLGWGSIINSIENGRELLKLITTYQIINPAQTIFHIQIRDWLISTAMICLIWLPWTLIIFLLPWSHFFSIPRKLIEYRISFPGHSWIWINTLITVLCIIFISSSDPLSIISLYSLIAILTAQCIISLTEQKSLFLYLGISSYFLVIGLLFLFVSLYPIIQTWLPQGFETDFPKTIESFFFDKLGIVIAAAICILSFFILWKFTNKRSPTGSLVVVVLCTTLLAIILSYYTTPTNPNETTLFMQLQHSSTPATTNRVPINRLPDSTGDNEDTVEENYHDL